jgi:hypothetical protein
MTGLYAWLMQGSYITTMNMIFDDNGVSTTDPVVQVIGNYNTVTHCTFVNALQTGPDYILEAYNAGTGSQYAADHFTFTYNTITHAKYGIATGAPATYFCTNGLIAYNTLSECYSSAIKFRHAQNCVAQNNSIDCSTFTWTQVSNPTGIRFGHIDGPTINCQALNNIITYSGGSQYNTRGIFIDDDTTSSTPGLSTGMIVQGNVIDKMTDYAIYVGWKGAKIINNSCSTSNYGLYLGVDGVSTQVNGNKFKGNTHQFVDASSPSGSTVRSGNLYDTSWTTGLRKLTTSANISGGALVIQGWLLASNEVCYTEDGSASESIGALAVSGYSISSFTINGSTKTPDSNGMIYQNISGTDYTIQAVYSATVTTYTLTISAPTGTGTTSPATGAWSYNSGAVATVTATAGSGYTFSNWVLDGSSGGSTNPISITMNAAHTLYAVFTATTAQYTLTMVAPSGSGSVSPAVGQWLYNSGVQATVSATAATGWAFDHWLIDGTTVSTDHNPGYIVMSSDRSIQAFFIQTTTYYTLTIGASTGTGTVSPVAGTYSEASGTVVQITATAGTGYGFDHWVLDGSSVTGNPYSVTMGANHTINAVFTVLNLTVNYSSTPVSVAVLMNNVAVQSGGKMTYPYGTTVVINAPASTPVATFVENCDTLDPTIWGYNWHAPTVVNGEFVFNAAIGAVSGDAIQIYSKQSFGYGTYTITFRMNQMINECNWSFFFYLNPTGNANGPFNELDIPEVVPSYIGQRTYITTYENSTGPAPWTNTQIVYLPTVQPAGNQPAYDDGNEHVISFVWEHDYIDFYIDGIKQYPNYWTYDDMTHTIKRTNTIPGKNPYPISDPPMPFLIGIFPQGGSTATWTLWISQITYTAG